ncbi:MAG: histidine kinase [Bacteroidales bacterium]
MKSDLLNRANKIFPWGRLFRLLLILVISIQFVIITYNHFSGFYKLDNISHFFIRLGVGTALGLIAAYLVAIPDLLIIGYLNKSFSWHRKTLPRVALQLLLTILAAVISSTIITFLSNSISIYKEGLGIILVYNALIFSVANIILMAIMEGWQFSMESTKARIRAEKLERELSQVRFEVLKSQINPHFMFNSLNVLSGLIENDVKRAQKFIDEFSQIYRYVLETIEKPVVSLSEELGFVRSYIFLQQIRYGESLRLVVDIPSLYLQKLLPPLSLQTVLENAIKHNIVNDSQPLNIEIYAKDSWLYVKNNIQPKISAGRSTGIGQQNMIKRYSMISERVPDFMFGADSYIAKLPLIESEYDEGPDN